MNRGAMIAAGTGLLLTALAGCADATADRAAMSWESPLYRDHPLAGKIWQPARQVFVGQEDMRAALKGADFLLVGEKHDNADHHALQALLVAASADEGRQGALVFEMLNAAQQEALEAHLAANPGDAGGIGAAVSWEKSGWPDWRIYMPIASRALDDGMPLLSGAIDRGVTKRIAREGPSVLGDERAARLMLHRPVAEELKTDMRQVIFESHCGHMPDSMLDPMIAVTLAKDAFMADRMIEARGPAAKSLPILIAGAGHVRADWGVPLHLKRRHPDARIVTVGLMEVVKDVIEPAEYAANYGGRMPFDFVWFTPRVDDKDPCEVFAGQLRKMRENRAQEGSGGGD